MKLSGAEREALHEYVEGRLAAGCQWHAIAESLEGYTLGEDPKLTEGDLDSLPGWHRAWKRRQVFQERQRARGDVRGGSGGIAEVEVDWQAADEGAQKLALLSDVCGPPSLVQRAEALKAVMYLWKGLLKARWRWVKFRCVCVPEGVVCERRRGPGRLVTAEGEAEWIWGAIVFRRVSDGVAVAVYEDCRLRGLRKAGWEKGRGMRAELERRELDGEMIDMRDLSARLATLIHVCLGGARSPFRNNEHLARLLGVSREAMRVRKKKIMRDAGIRSAVGMAPNRAAGGRECQRRKIQGAKSKIEGPEEVQNPNISQQP